MTPLSLSVFSIAKPHTTGKQTMDEGLSAKVDGENEQEQDTKALLSHLREAIRMAEDASPRYDVIGTLLANAQRLNKKCRIRKYGR